MFYSIQCRPFVYVKNYQKGSSIILVWIDNIIIAASSSFVMGNVKEKLRDSFNMKDLDEISSFLGMQFGRRNDIIKMRQSMYSKNILRKFGMENWKPRLTPCESYYKDEANDDIINEKKYREIVGSLVYSMIYT